jgi:hypothetical protein
MKSTTRPNFIHIPILEPNPQPQAQEKGILEITDEERVLHAMSQSGGWKVFEDIAKRATAELATFNRTAIANGVSLEEIGRNTVVISMVQDLVEKLFNKVKDAKEACENAK